MSRIQRSGTACITGRNADMVYEMTRYVDHWYDEDDKSGSKHSAPVETMQTTAQASHAASAQPVGTEQASYNMPYGAQPQGFAYEQLMTQVWDQNLGMWTYFAPAPGNWLATHTMLLPVPAPQLGERDVSGPLQSRPMQVPASDKAIVWDKAAINKSKQRSKEKNTDGTPMVELPDGTPIPLKDLPVDLLTTVKFQNFPDDFTRDHLCRYLDYYGFSRMYDFVYLPMVCQEKTWRPKKNEWKRTYAFVNFTSHEAAMKARECFERMWPATPTGWVVHVIYATADDHKCNYNDKKKDEEYFQPTSWADAAQGLNANIQRCRDSKLMRLPSLLDYVKPARYENGRRVGFAKPTKR